MAVTGFRKFCGAMLAGALAFQASAAGAVCVTEPEAKAVALFIAPDMLRALSGTCRASLPAGAYLVRSNDMLVSRYRAVSGSAWPGVQALIGRIPETKMFRNLDENAARGLIGAMLQDKALGKISASNCTIANQTLEALDPLPPQNMASLIVALARFGEAAGREAPAKAGSKPGLKPSIFCGAPPVPASVTVTVPSK